MLLGEAVTTHLLCPYCGKRVEFPDDGATVGHELPICAGFLERMEELGLELKDVQPRRGSLDPQKQN